MIHNRRSIRLKGYDYSLPGAYFVTMVTWKREEIFGKIVNAKMYLSDFGKIAYEEWYRTAELRTNVTLYENEFVVMPNHVHGIIWIIDNPKEKPSSPTPANETEKFGKPKPDSLSTIIRAYKSAVTYRINGIQETRGIPIWQRNYYEHIIRNEIDLKNISNYIDNNPLRWQEDQFRPPVLTN
jgi:putative transposase